MRTGITKESRKKNEIFYIGGLDVDTDPSFVVQSHISINHSWRKRTALPGDNTQIYIYKSKRHKNNKRQTYIKCDRTYATTCINKYV